MPTLADLYPSQTVDLAASDARGGGPADAIAFRVQPQRMSQWCWAAVTASVVAYKDPAHQVQWTQCGIASAELNSQCCAQPTPGGCDQQNSLDGPLARVGRLREPIITGYLSPNAIAAEIGADLPVPLRVQWQAGGGHFLAIYGLRGLPNGVQLALSDPIFGETLIMGNALVQGGYQAGGGRWTHSYVVKG